MKKQTFMFLAALLLFLLVACTPSADGSGKAVETYLQALADENQDRLLTTSCAEWEESATLELEAFTGVSASLNQVECNQTAFDGETALVTCQGTIEATYNNELRQLTLQGKTFRVIQDRGNWLVCGYQE